MGFGDVKLLAMLGAFSAGRVRWASSCWRPFWQRGGAGHARLAPRAGQDPAAPRGPRIRPPEAIAGGGGDDEEITLEGHYLPFGPYPPSANPYLSSVRNSSPCQHPQSPPGPAAPVGGGSSWNGHASPHPLPSSLPMGGVNVFLYRGREALTLFDTGC